jgi:RNA polymerase sigma-70 factor (ECF subfamily)
MTGPNRRQFERVILPHLDATYNLARWMVLDSVLAEEVVQDAVLRALGYFSKLRLGNRQVSILRIVRNTAYEHLGKRGAHADVSPGRAMDQADAAGFGMDARDAGPDRKGRYAGLQDRERLTSSLAALPIEQRECLVLCELERLSYKDIARITKVPVGTVMSRLSRARSALRQIAFTSMSHGEREPALA